MKNTNTSPKEYVKNIFPNADIRITDGYIIVNRIPKATTNDTDFQFYISNDKKLFKTPEEAWEDAEDWTFKTLYNEELYKNPIFFELSEKGRELHLNYLKQNKDSVEEEIYIFNNGLASDDPDETEHFENLQAYVNKIDKSIREIEILQKDLKHIGFGPLNYNDIINGNLVLLIPQTNKHFNENLKNDLPRDIINDIINNNYEDIDLRLLYYKNENLAITQSFKDNTIHAEKNKHLFYIDHFDAINYLNIKHPDVLYNLQKKVDKNQLSYLNTNLHNFKIYKDFTPKEQHNYLQYLKEELSNTKEELSNLKSNSKQKKYLENRIDTLKNNIKTVSLINTPYIKPKIGEELADFIEEVWSNEEENILVEGTHYRIVEDFAQYEIQEKNLETNEWHKLKETDSYPKTSKFDTPAEVLKVYRNIQTEDIKKNQIVNKKFQPNDVLTNKELLLLNKHKDFEYLELNKEAMREHIIEIRNIYDKVKLYSETKNSNPEINNFLSDIIDTAKEVSNIEFDIQKIKKEKINKSDIKTATFVLFDSKPEKLAVLRYANEHSALIQYFNANNIKITAVDINTIEPLNSKTAKEIIKKYHKDAYNVIKQNKKIPNQIQKYRIETIKNKFQIQKYNSVLGWKELKKPLEKDINTFSSIAEAFTKLSELNNKLQKKTSLKI